MELSIVIQSIAIIYLMILIGAALSKTFSFNEDTRGVFISLIVNIAMPSIILSSIFNVKMDDDTFSTIILVFLLSILINVVGIGVGWLLSFTFYNKSNKHVELALLAGLGNTGFIGIPLCAVLIGPEGALYAAIFDAGVDFTIWTVGVLMLQKGKSIGLQTFKSMINIPLVSIFVGLIISYFHYRPPALIINLVDQLSALAAPLAMFYIGILVMTLKFSKVKESGLKVWIPISVKLMMLPALVALLIGYFHLNMTIVQTVLIQSMMPTLTLASILFAKYSADKDMGAITTVLATVLALLTIPVIIYILTYFSLFT
ncbi:AEC family transporter [Sporosarcina sp. G11-34]|uniref:AEC family transporter n=1 Tax=Sporosarcina sp. G11-34 TaxID=2849605 RepID=UPI0022A90C11|nr:AEC family transporter [Sporosarcina sp. G11-34]MCZ2258220.1 AEC family transporter [Sporosarcina sp. G11-34]